MGAVDDVAVVLGVHQSLGAQLAAKVLARVCGCSRSRVRKGLQRETTNMWIVKSSQPPF